ncbi:MAG: hypothetical protein ABSF44_12890 [Candidatus Bathyarchaeia archaeon]
MDKKSRKGVGRVGLGRDGSQPATPQAQTEKVTQNTMRQNSPPFVSAVFFGLPKCLSFLLFLRVWSVFDFS